MRRFRAIYTCTPVAFHANRGFHIRDSGLIARHLRLLGLESKCIMPLPYYEDDSERDNLIRVEMEKLRDPSWWRSLGIDGVGSTHGELRAMALSLEPFAAPGSGC